MRLEKLKAYKVHLIGIIVLPLLFVAIGLHFYRLPWGWIESLEAVPNNAALVLELNSYNKAKDLYAHLPFSASMSKWLLAERLKEDVEVLKPLFSKQPEALNEGRLTIALEANGAQELNYVYILNTKWQRVDIAERLSKVKSSKYNKYNFKGDELYCLLLEDGRSYTFAAYKNLILVAKHALMVEDALSQLQHKSSNLLNQPEFQKAYNTVNPVATLNLYLNFEALSPTFGSFVETAKRQMMVNSGKNLGWLALSVLPNKDGIQFLGGLTPRGDNALCKQLRNPNFTDKKNIATILPANTAFLTWIGMGDFKKTFGAGSALTGGMEFYQFFADWVGNDMAYFITEPHTSNVANDCYLALHVRDTALAREQLHRFEHVQGQSQHFDYGMFTINQVLGGKVLNTVLGETWGNIENPYYAIVGDYAIFANTRSSIELLIDQYIVGRTLSNDAHYLEFSASLDERKTNFYTYANTAFLQEFLQSSLQEDVQVQIAQSASILKELRLFGLHLDAEGDVYKVTGTYKFGNKKAFAAATQTSIAWKTTLASAAAIAPALVNSPTGEYEIFVEDVDNQIYLLNRAGEVRWKRRIDGKILSDIFQIDYFNNGNLYYVFNTAEKIYLLDKDSKDVSTFPFVLQSPATTGMTVIDFENAKEYSYFVPCKNQNIYGFNKNCRPLPGWNPKQYVGIVKQPLFHFQKDSKDYIIALTENGTMRTFKRDGSNRFEAKEYASALLSPIGFQADIASCRIVVADAKGKIHVCNLQGEDFSLLAPVGASTNVKMAFADVTGDNRKDYVMLSDKTIACYGYDSANFVKKFAIPLTETHDEIFPVQMVTKSRTMIGVVCKKLGQISLYEGAKRYADFPLAGNTTFNVTDLFGDGTNTLVVASGDGVYAYRLR